MTSIFSDGALHPGRDANDALWIVLRRPEDWAGAVLTDVVVDPAGPVLTLTPGALGGPADTGGEVTGLDGTVYRADPAGDQVLRKRPCDASWSRFIGARGTESGKLRHPLGLALDARRNLLAIADAGNHRVQLVRADGGEPVLALGCFDVWGRGVAPGPGVPDPRALAEPVAVAFGRRYFAIADRAGGHVHVYDDRFAFVRAFAPVPPDAPAPFQPAPAAVALDGCVVWVIDTAWSAAVAYGVDGVPIADAGSPPAELAPWLARATWAPSGEVVAGPIDGQTDDLAWHRVIVDAALPAGTAVEVQTFASDDSTAPAVIPWAPGRPVGMPLAGVEPTDGVADRPVLSDQGRWARKRGEPYVPAHAPIAALAGTGPVNAAGFQLAWPAARRLRAGDLVELRTATGPSGTRPITGISGRTISAVTRGTLQVYGAGSVLTLRLRDGEAILGGPRVIAELAPGEALDASGADDDGTLYDLPATHAVAALLRDGDVVTLTAGGASATLVISAVARTEATVVLGATVGDFATSKLWLVTAVGRLVVGALDWTDDVPSGEPIDVHDDDAGTEVAATIRWAERDNGTLWLAPGPLVPYATWTRFTLPEPIATDRGRYLWLRLRLLGAVAHAGDAVALASPAIRAVRLLLPRPSLLRLLPAVYSRRDAGDPSGALFLERLLALPEHRLTAVEAAYEDVAREVNPRAASPDWLRFLAAWFGLVFDPSWPLARRRELVIHANELFAKRGTAQGIRRYFEIYTGTSPAIIESFQWGGVAPSVRAHHFSIWVFGDGGPCGTVVTDRAARAILDSIKPAHTTYDLHVIDGMPRVGIASTVGVDMVLIGGELTPAIGLAAQPLAVLGRTSLPAAPQSSTRLGPIPLDDDFTLT